MASNSRDREELLSSFTNPSQSSSPITVSDHLDLFLEHSGSTPGSFQNDGILSYTASDQTADSEYGFSRPDFGESPLVGTVQFYQRHVFLCYKNPRVWPPRIEAAEFDRLPRLLAAAVAARKGDMKKETQLTICEGHDGTETSNGDVLIFPDMIRYRRLTHFDVETFVEEVLVKESEWLPGTPEMLKGSYVFVCSHGSRDRRCGFCGPALITRFREEIELRSFQGKVSVSPCSHIGGHKYAGNVIIFAKGVGREVSGHWYGYVAPDDVPVLLEQHIGKGEIVDSLWRGQMGLSEEEQVKFLEQQFHQNGDVTMGKSSKDVTDRDWNQTTDSAGQPEFFSCCQGNGNASCCQSPSSEKMEYGDSGERARKVTAEGKSSKKLWRINSGKGFCSRKVCTMPTWLESWEREDTYAALAVVCAAVSVMVAYSCIGQLR